ncbi:MAG: hypothetical protein EOP87_23570 [Verrucomicrobiaceae bacterium]|nr:MAG: hypothetical protein EOP87_23570 [Verrucomicrobiaceae bacterium]
MTDTPKQECLFIGGSADGQRLEVDHGQLEIRLPSLSGQPALQDPVARALDTDPIPDETVVHEVYRRLDVEADAGDTIVYALNGMGEDSISVQLTKHFGSAESAPLM